MKISVYNIIICYITESISRLPAAVVCIGGYTQCTIMPQVAGSATLMVSGMIYLATSTRGNSNGECIIVG